jgi:hypothetical protein
MSEALITLAASENDVDILLWSERGGYWRSAWRIPGEAVWHVVSHDAPEQTGAIENAQTAAARARAHPRRKLKHGRPGLVDAPVRLNGSAAAGTARLRDALRSFAKRQVSDEASGAKERATADQVVFERALKAAFPARRPRR